MDSFKDKVKSVGDALDSNAFTAPDDDRNDRIDEAPSAQELGEGAEHQGDIADQQGTAAAGTNALLDRDR
ncbi:MAG: hypothetical protein H0V86_09910 [Chloroflexia bacterium]|nr:hypothetical protein [Chloroflexia bacterium]